MNPPISWYSATDVYTGCGIAPTTGVGRLASRGVRTLHSRIRITPGVRSSNNTRPPADACVRGLAQTSARQAPCRAMRGPTP